MGNLNKFQNIQFWLKFLCSKQEFGDSSVEDINYCIKYYADVNEFSTEK